MSSNLSSTNFPELWAAKSVATLYSQLVLAALCYRDYDNAIAEHGDTVNIRRPQNLTVRSWAGQSANTDDIADSEITVEVPKAKNLQVVLSQHDYVSFMEENKDAALSIENIQKQFIDPAIIPLAESIDSWIGTQMLADIDIDGDDIAVQNRAGASLAATDISRLTTKLNVQRCPNANRNLVLTSEAYGEAMEIDLFVHADKSGSTTALQEAFLGRKFGLNSYQTQNLPSVLPGTDAETLLGIAFTPNAFAFLTRRLPPLDPIYGVVTAYAVHEGYSCRIQKKANLRGMGVDVVMDVLYGGQLVDRNLAHVLAA